VKLILIVGYITVLIVAIVCGLRKTKRAMRAVIISERLIVNVKIVFVRGFINKIIYI